MPQFLPDTSLCRSQRYEAKWPTVIGRRSYWLLVGAAIGCWPLAFGFSWPGMISAQVKTIFGIERILPHFRKANSGGSSLRYEANGQPVIVRGVNGFWSVRLLAVGRWLLSYLVLV